MAVTAPLEPLALEACDVVPRVKWLVVATDVMILLLATAVFRAFLANVIFRINAAAQITAMIQATNNAAQTIKEPATKMSPAVATSAAGQRQHVKKMDIAV
jgi:hypothetical protein